MPARRRPALPASTPSPAARADATLTVAPAAAVDLDEPAAASPWIRYEDLGVLGAGNMGEVHRVRDRILGRTLAMKMLAARGRGHRARFLAEARLSAGLSHPGIVPVHDCGVAPDGRLWFTMDEVRGRSLRRAIEDAHRGGGPSPAALRRLAGGFLRVCEAVAHAHRSGVVHRDLKPDNIMLGDLGEVLVVDWGLAGPVGAASAGPLTTDARRGARLTQEGHVMGTPAYMPPEQAWGRVAEIDQRSDVYALGATLYQILCGRAPFSGTARAVLARVGRDLPDPLAGAAAAGAPPELVAIGERAMASERAARFADAGALADEVRSFLDGERRRERALSLVREALLATPHVGEERAKARDLRREAAAVLGAIDAWEPVERKAAGWALEDEARAREIAAAVEEAGIQSRLHAALAESPDLAEAHAALADLHAAELLAAEAARDPAAAARAETLLARHDRGAHAAFLGGAASVSIVTDPPGAEVWAFRYVERARRLVEESLGLLGRTPLRDAALPPGSYLLRLRARGRVETRLPIHLPRGGRFRGERPGSAAPHAIALPRPGDLGDDEIYVPAGFFQAGGDPAAPESLPAQEVWVDGFVLGRTPVSVAAYLAFLNDLTRSGRDAEAEAACPCLPTAVAGGLRVPVIARGADGRYVPPERAADDPHRWPVVSISWLAAAAYATWLSARTGLGHRLPGELEREKAARGADGRFFPWGDHPEPTWASMAGSAPGAPALTPLDAFPVDESPFGARGLAGNVRDWCADVWTPTGPPIEAGVLRIVPAAPGDPSLRSVRGGSCFGPSQLCRAAGRFAARPEELGAAVGLRLARPFPGPRDQR